MVGAVENIGDVTMKSAVDSVVAMGIFHTAATLNSALTSGSWAAALRGSQDDDVNRLLGYAGSQR